MNKIITYILIIIGLIIITIIIFPGYKKVRGICGKFFIVLNHARSVDVANILCAINSKCNLLISHLSAKDPNNIKIKRLIQKFNGSNIVESRNETYTLNKGSKIYICIKDKKTSQFYDMNTLMFVTLHEITHIMTDSYGHTESFWKNNKFLMNEAQKIGIYIPINYKKNPVKYCKVTINVNPLYS